MALKRVKSRLICLEFGKAQSWLACLDEGSSNSVGSQFSTTLKDTPRCWFACSARGTARTSRTSSQLHNTHQNEQGTGLPTTCSTTEQYLLGAWYNQWSIICASRGIPCCAVLKLSRCIPALGHESTSRKMYFCVRSHGRAMALQGLSNCQKFIFPFSSYVP